MRSFRFTLPDAINQGALRVMLENGSSGGCEVSFTPWLITDQERYMRKRRMIWANYT